MKLSGICIALLHLLTNCGREDADLLIKTFGSLFTTIRIKQLADNAKITIILCGQAANGLLNTFGEGRQGDLAAVIDSGGYLNVYVVNRRAKQTLDPYVGDNVHMLLP